VKNRTELISFQGNDVMAEGHLPLSVHPRSKAKWRESVRNSHDDPDSILVSEMDIQMIESCDRAIAEMEKRIEAHALETNSQAYHIIRSLPGIGKVLALTILYETINIRRFPTVKNYVSYSRLVCGSNSSAGKDYGSRGRKMGNPYLKWAFMQAAVLCKRSDEQLARYAEKLKRKHGKYTANAIMGAKIARAIYFMLDRKTTFSPELLIKGKRR